MTTKLESVLAEEWTHNGRGITQRTGAKYPQGSEVVVTLGEFGECGEFPEDVTRAAVAVLGKRALAMVLKHEFADGKIDGGYPCCPECTAHDDRGHAPTCEWGRIVTSAKELA